MVATLLPAAVALIASPAGASADSIRWEQAVLIVFAAGERDAALDHQRRIAERARPEFLSRRLRIVEVVGESVSGVRDYAPKLRQRYRVGGGDFAAMLVDGDGEIRVRADRPIDPEQLFAPFDSAAPLH